MEFLNNKEIFPDFKVGPLTAYRNKSSFDFKKLKIIIEDQQALELRHKVWSFMETNPEFARSPRELNLDELRHEANRRMLTVFNEKFFGFEMVCYINIYFIYIKILSNNLNIFSI